MDVPAPLGLSEPLDWKIRASGTSLSPLHAAPSSPASGSLQNLSLLLSRLLQSVMEFRSFLGLQSKAQDPQSAVSMILSYFPLEVKKYRSQGSTDSNNSLHLWSTYSSLDAVLRADGSALDIDSSPWSLYVSPHFTDE